MRCQTYNRIVEKFVTAENLCPPCPPQQGCSDFRGRLPGPFLTRARCESARAINAGFSSRAQSGGSRRPNHEAMHAIAGIHFRAWIRRKGARMEQKVPCCVQGQVKLKGFPMNISRVRFETEAELRAFFASCGLSSLVIERAVKARYQPPQ